MCCHGDERACQDKTRNIQGPCRETEWPGGGVGSSFLEGMQLGSNVSS